MFQNFPKFPDILKFPIRMIEPEQREKTELYHPVMQRNLV